MKEAIFKLIKERNHVSMVELGRYIMGFSGDREWYFNDNTVIWNECSEEGIQAMTELLREGRIIMKSDHKLVYIMDGLVPRYPVAKDLDRHYKTPHWIPVTFTTPKEKA